jgi:hypothetical protein
VCCCCVVEDACLVLVLASVSLLGENIPCTDEACKSELQNDK